MAFNLYDLFPLQYQTEIRMLGREIVLQVVKKLKETGKKKLTIPEIIDILDKVVEAPVNNNLRNQ